MSEFDVKRIRTKIGLTQKELAEKIGITQRAVQKWDTPRHASHVAPTPSCSMIRWAGKWRRQRKKSDKGIEIFLFAFALADVVLELGAHGLRLVEDGADVGLDGHFLLPAAHGSEWLRADQLCGSAWVCRTVENGM